VLDQGLDMTGVLDLRTLVVAAAMTGEHLRVIDDAHLVRICQHREQALHLAVRDGIVVKIEAHIGRLAGLHRHALDERIGLSGSASSLGASAEKASRTLRPSCPGQHRSAARPRHQASAWTLRSSKSVNRACAHDRARHHQIIRGLWRGTPIRHLVLSGAIATGPRRMVHPTAAGLVAPPGRALGVAPRLVRSKSGRDHSDCRQESELGSARTETNRAAAAGNSAHGRVRQ
jgi:hypothetical protein